MSHYSMEHIPSNIKGSDDILLPGKVPLDLPERILHFVNR